MFPPAQSVGCSAEHCREWRGTRGGSAFFWSELTPLGAQSANHLPYQLCGDFITIPVSLCFRGISQVGFTSRNLEVKDLGISPPIIFKMWQFVPGEKSEYKHYPATTSIVGMLRSTRAEGKAWLWQWVGPWWPMGWFGQARVPLPTVKEPSGLTGTGILTTFLEQSLTKRLSAKNNVLETRAAWLL